MPLIPLVTSTRGGSRSTRSGTLAARLVAAEPAAPRPVAHRDRERRGALERAERRGIELERRGLLAAHAARQQVARDTTRRAAPARRRPAARPPRAASAGPSARRSRAGPASRRRGLSRARLRAPSRPGGSPSARYHAKPPIPTTAISRQNQEPARCLHIPSPRSAAKIPDARVDACAARGDAAHSSPEAPMNRLRRIVLLRHGDTVGNSRERFHGSSDVALSDEGRAQVRAAGRRARDRGVRGGRGEPAAARVAERGAARERRARAARARVPRDRLRPLGGAHRGGDRGAGPGALPRLAREGPRLRVPGRRAARGVPRARGEGARRARAHGRRERAGRGRTPRRDPRARPTAARSALPLARRGPELGEIVSFTRDGERWFAWGAAQPANPPALGAAANGVVASADIAAYGLS